MKIADIKPYVVVVKEGLPWVFVEVFTDEGVTGLGECTDYRSAPMMVAGIETAKSLVVGQDPSHIEEIWQRIFRNYSTLNGRGYVSHIISGIDIALWDIRGKVLGQPVYQLLGGPVRPSVPLYTHIQDYTYPSVTPRDAAEAAKKTKAEGYSGIKTDPFKLQRLRTGPWRGADFVERLSPKVIADAVEWMGAVRDAVGPDYELMVDAHGRFDVASAIEAGKALEPFKLVWYEEPVPPEGLDALRQVRENVRIPLCVGERLFTRWDYVPIFEHRLAEYVMPDIAWCGGISELRRIAAMAEPYFVRVTPHDALGPVDVTATFHVSMTIPNFYREECLHTWFEDFKKIVTPLWDYHDGAIWPNDRPGLGINLDRDALKRFQVDPGDRRARVDR